MNSWGGGWGGASFSCSNKHRNQKIAFLEVKNASYVYPTPLLRPTMYAENRPPPYAFQWPTVVTFRESLVSRSLFLGIASFSFPDHQLRITLKQSINGRESFSTCRSHEDHFEFADHSWKALTKRCFDDKSLILVVSRRKSLIPYFGLKSYLKVCYSN